MMTSVLRDSLGGNCMTTMIATCAIEKRNLDVSNTCSVVVAFRSVITLFYELWKTGKCLEIFVNKNTGNLKSCSFHVKNIPDKYPLVWFQQHFVSYGFTFHVFNRNKCQNLNLSANLVYLKEILVVSHLHDCEYQLKCLTLLHSEWPKLYGVLAVLSAIGLSWMGMLLFAIEGKQPFFLTCCFPGEYILLLKESFMPRGANSFL